MNIEINGNYTTTFNAVVIIYAITSGDYPVKGAYYYNKEWRPSSWTLDGKHPSSTDTDISMNLIESDPWFKLIPKEGFEVREEERNETLICYQKDIFLQIATGLFFLNNAPINQFTLITVIKESL